MLDGLDGPRWPPGAQLHVALDDAGRRHVVQAGPRNGGRTASTQVVEGDYEAVQEIGGRQWRIQGTAFWPAHRDAPPGFSELVSEAAQVAHGLDAAALRGGRG